MAPCRSSPSYTTLSLATPQLHDTFTLSDFWQFPESWRMFHWSRDATALSDGGPHLTSNLFLRGNTTPSAILPPPPPPAPSLLLPQPQPPTTSAAALPISTIEFLAGLTILTQRDSDYLTTQTYAALGSSRRRNKHNPAVLPPSHPPPYYTWRLSDTYY